MALNFSFIRLLICLLKFHTLQTHTWDYHAHNSIQVILFLFKKLGSICLLISFMLSRSILLSLFHEMKKKIFHLFFPEDILNFSIANIYSNYYCPCWVCDIQQRVRVLNRFWFINSWYKFGEGDSRVVIGVSSFLCTGLLYIAERERKFIIIREVERKRKTWS